MGIDSIGEVVPVNASGIVTPEGEASILDNSQPKNLFGETTTQETVETETIINDNALVSGFGGAAAVAGPFLSDCQDNFKGKQLASVSFLLKTKNPDLDTYAFYIIDLGTNVFPTDKTALAALVAPTAWRNTYTKFFEVTISSADLNQVLNFKLDGSDDRVTYRNSTFIDNENYLVIPDNHWILVGDPDNKTAFGYDRAAQTTAEYNKVFFYLTSAGTSYGNSSGNLSYSFYERTYETEEVTTQNFDEYLKTNDVVHSDIINQALEDIEYLKEHSPASESPLKGKYISLIGDSITTFQGWSNIAPGSTSAAVYYPNPTATYPILDVNQTYWKKLVDRTGMNLLVNNSWSGSHCAGSASSSVVSQTNDRCHQLHKDGINPDIILINIGTNDFDHDYELGTWNGRGVLFPANPTTTSPNTFREAYAVMLYRLRQYYPLAKVYCCTIPCGNNEGGEGLNEMNGTGYTLSEWNDAIREVATAFGVKVIEMATAGMDYYTLDTLYGDGRVHPSEAGMERMYEIIRPALENEYTSNVSAPRLSKLMTGTIPTVSLSTATNIETLVNDYNILLSWLENRGVIVTSSTPSTSLVVHGVIHEISSIADLILYDNKTLSSGSAEASWALAGSANGRVCIDTQVVEVPTGNTTVTWSPSNDLTTAFPDLAFSVFELTSTGNKNTNGVMSDSWKTANLVLDSNTKYIKLTFKLNSSAAVTTTSEQKEALKAAISFS